MRAVPNPLVIMTSAMPTKTDTKATRPKSLGKSSRARITAKTERSTCVPIRSMKLQIKAVAVFDLRIMSVQTGAVTRRTRPSQSGIGNREAVRRMAGKVEGDGNEVRRVEGRWQPGKPSCSPGSVSTGAEAPGRAGGPIGVPHL